MTEAEAAEVERELHPHPAITAGELRRMQLERRAAETLARLKAHQIHYDAAPGRPMVVIRLKGRTFEIWPSTERWRERDTQMSVHRIAWHRAARRRGVGVDSLLAEIRRPS